MTMPSPPLQSIKKVLIANRGEIAVRCIRACRAVGVTSVAIFTESDAASLHVTLADEFVQLAGDGTAGYLNIDDVLEICKRCSIDAVIPGYGFLSENVEFATRIGEAGMVFVGPSPESITEMGLKHRAREVAQAANVPVIAGTGLLATAAEALEAAERLKYPVMLKATGGGGGMGLHICESAADVSAGFAMVQSRGEKLFRNSGLLLEKYYPRSRHIEVQVFGNGTDTIHFGERECSIQRRHQKVIEECPSPFVEAHPGLRKTLTDCATKYAAALNYKSAGTVEFLVDDDTGDFFFLEMNTRLQVEHGITEMCYGVDLVILMLRQADLERSGAGGIPTSELRGLQRSGPDGAAIEARIYAEDPYRDFSPSPGIFQEVHWPEQEGVRIDSWIQSGQQISLHYDPLLAKAMVHAPTRKQAVEKMSELCSQGIALKGPTTNLDFVRAIIGSEPFAKGDTLTSLLDTGFSYHPCGIDVLSGGTYSTIQDFPARPSLGHGIPKSGPMDSISSRIANLLVSNPPGMEVVEVTLQGPELLFTSAAVISVCGASCSVTVDGTERPMWSSLVIQEGQRLKIGAVTGAGCRVYLAVRGGFPDIPLVFGSKSTTPSLKYGGCQGRTLRTGDFLRLQDSSSDWAASTREFCLPPSLIPDMDVKEIYVLQGPHDSDDIMTGEDRDMLYSFEWEIGYNSTRTGARLVGPAPKWARKSGGEAGSHPSNYLDYGYPAPGGMNWGGDSPCIFTVDSPNFGGLICSSTVISSDLWKLGQLKPGDSCRLTPVSLENAVQQIERVNRHLSVVSSVITGQANVAEAPACSWRIPRDQVEANRAMLKVVLPSSEDTLRPKVVYRQGGDRFLLVEIGEQSVSVAVIARIELLLGRIRAQSDLTKLLLTPHVGSLTIEYDPLSISQSQLLARIHEIESNIPTTVDLSIPCREFRLPLVMDHPAIQQCIEKYMETVRAKAAYLPDNLEYVRKCNGLSSRRDVFDLLIQTDFLIAAVGFLCGAPMLFPLTPKTLMCQKYNPTRVSTPGGTIAFGGSILAGYSNEQPGGYMLAARSLEMWDASGTKPGFAPDRPWIFEPFDKVKFYEVSVDEYDSLAKDFAAGRYHWQISESVFDVRQAFEMFQRARTDPEMVEFRRRQREGLAEQEEIEAAIYAEWKASVAVGDEEDEPVDLDLDNGKDVPVFSPMAASVWKVEVKPGDRIKEGQLLAILEAMKMEINILAPREADGLLVHTIVKKPNSLVSAGDVIMVTRADANVGGAS